MRESLRASLGTQALGPPGGQSTNNIPSNNRQQYQTSQSQRRGGGGSNNGARNGMQVPSTTPTSNQFFSSGSMESRRNYSQYNNNGSSNNNSGGGGGGPSTSMTFSDSSSSSGGGSNNSFGRPNPPANTPHATPVENGMEDRYQEGYANDQRMENQNGGNQDFGYGSQNEVNGMGVTTRKVVGGFDGGQTYVNGSGNSNSGGNEVRQQNA